MITPIYERFVTYQKNQGTLFVVEEKGVAVMIFTDNDDEVIFCTAVDKLVLDIIVGLGTSYVVDDPGLVGGSTSYMDTYQKKEMDMHLLYSWIDDIITFGLGVYDIPGNEIDDMDEIESPSSNIVTLRLSRHDFLQFCKLLNGAITVDSIRETPIKKLESINNPKSAIALFEGLGLNDGEDVTFTLSDHAGFLYADKDHIYAESTPSGTFRFFIHDYTKKSRKSKQASLGRFEIDQSGIAILSAISQHVINGSLTGDKNTYGIFTIGKDSNLNNLSIDISYDHKTQMFDLLFKKTVDGITSDFAMTVHKGRYLKFLNNLA